MRSLRAQFASLLTKTRVLLEEAAFGMRGGENQSRLHCFRKRPESCTELLSEHYSAYLCSHMG